MEELKEQVKRQLTSPTKNHADKLRLIDSIQRLGISYHFETEIDKTLHQIHKMSSQNDDDLQTTTLRFRLLRQQGYNISSGKFRSNVVEIWRGLLF